MKKNLLYFPCFFWLKAQLHSLQKSSVYSCMQKSLSLCCVPCAIYVHSCSIYTTPIHKGKIFYLPVFANKQSTPQRGGKSEYKVCTFISFLLNHLTMLFMGQHSAKYFACQNLLLLYLNCKKTCKRSELERANISCCFYFPLLHQICSQIPVEK